MIKRYCYNAAVYLTFFLSTCGAFVPALADASLRNNFVNSWNAIEDSVPRINQQRQRLGELVERYPPWHVNAPAQVRERQEIYDNTIRELQTMVREYKRLKEIDK